MGTSSNRFSKLIERKDDADFPFYTGKPAEIATWKWVTIIVACAIGMVVLNLFGSSDQRWELIPRILFTGIPLLAFWALAKPYWKAIFRPVKARDFGLMIVFWLLNLVVSAAVAFIAAGGHPENFTANSATDGLLEGGVWNVVAFYVGTFIQLFGEEVFTILPFLAVLYWLTKHAKLSRRTAVIASWLITAVWFGAAHLPTYGWNFVQAIVVIGAARIVLTLAFIRTKNILVSFGAHLINDWATFTLALIAAAAAVK